MNHSTVAFVLSFFCVATALADEQEAFQSAVQSWWQAALEEAALSKDPALLLAPIEDVMSIFPHSTIYRRDGDPKQRFVQRVCGDLSQILSSRRGPQDSLGKKAKIELRLLEIHCRRQLNPVAASEIKQLKSWDKQVLSILQHELPAASESEGLDWRIRRALAELRMNPSQLNPADVLRLFRDRERVAHKQFDAQSITLAEYLEVQANLLFLEYSELNSSAKKAGQVATAYGHLLQAWRKDASQNAIPASPKYCQASQRRLEAMSESELPNLTIVAERTNYLALAQSLEWSQVARPDHHLTRLYKVFRMDAATRLGQHRKTLANHLDHNDSFRVRQHAAMSLAWLLEQGIGDLIDAMGHEDIETQKFVRHVVGRQGDVALPALLRAATSHSKERVRHNAVLAIGYIGPTTSELNKLRQLQKQEQSQLVQTALQGVLDAQKQYSKLPAPKKPALPGIWSPDSFR